MDQVGLEASLAVIGECLVVKSDVAAKGGDRQ